MLTRKCTSTIFFFPTERTKYMILQSTEVLNQSRGGEKMRRKREKGNYRRIKIPNLLKI